MFKSTQPLQELVNRGTDFLAIGLEQFRQFSGIWRALAEREKRRFYTYWCKAETYLCAIRQEMSKHKILLDVISKTNDQIIKRTQLEPLAELYAIQEEMSRHEILLDEISKTIEQNCTR